MFPDSRQRACDLGSVRGPIAPLGVRLSRATSWNRRAPFASGETRGLQTHLPWWDDDDDDAGGERDVFDDNGSK